MRKLGGKSGARPFESDGHVTRLDHGKPGSGCPRTVCNTGFVREKRCVQSRTRPDLFDECQARPHGSSRRVRPGSCGRTRSHGHLSSLRPWIRTRAGQPPDWNARRFGAGRRAGPGSREPPESAGKGLGLDIAAAGHGDDGFRQAGAEQRGGCRSRSGACRRGVRRTWPCRRRAAASIRAMSVMAGPPGRRGSHPGKRVRRGREHARGPALRQRPCRGGAGASGQRSLR